MVYSYSLQEIQADFEFVLMCSSERLKFSVNKPTVKYLGNMMTRFIRQDELSSHSSKESTKSQNLKEFFELSREKRFFGKHFGINNPVNDGIYFDDETISISFKGDLYLFVAGYFRRRLDKSSILSKVLKHGSRAYSHQLKRLNFNEHLLLEEKITYLKEVCENLSDDFSAYADLINEARINFESMHNKSALLNEYRETGDKRIFMYLCDAIDAEFSKCAITHTENIDELLRNL